MLRPYAPELSMYVVKILGDGGYTGEKFTYEVESLIESRDRDCQAQRITQIYSTSKAVDC
jgi:hypothetical protein